MRFNSSQYSNSILGEFSQKKKTGKISNRVIEEMLESANILDILEQEYDLYFDPGNNGWWNTNCPLPGHDDSSPSFGVNPESGFFHCFGCQSSGNILTFIQKVEGLNFPEALLRLSVITGVGLEDGQGELYRTVKDIRDAIQDYLSREGATNLPGGMSEPVFLRSIATRLTNFEKKTNFNPESYAFSDSIYGEVDALMIVQDYKKLNNLWKNLGQRINHKIKEINQSQDTND